MSEEGQPAKNVVPTAVYGLFAGSIDQTAVQRFHNALTIASQNGVREAHLVFQCSGGIIGDGISLYNLFRASPVDITLYNIGNVCSIGVIAYLGAKVRKTSAHGAFMIHRAHLNPATSNSDKMTSGADQLIMEDDRLETILKAHINLPPKLWKQHKHSDVWLSAKQAVEFGFAEIGEFAPPPGTNIFNIWPPQN